MKVAISFFFDALGAIHVVRNGQMSELKCLELTQRHVRNKLELVAVDASDQDNHVPGASRANARGHISM